VQVRPFGEFEAAEGGVPVPVRGAKQRTILALLALHRGKPVSAELMTLMWAGSRGYRMEPRFPAVLTDDELRSIDVPALLVTGARSALLTPKEARARGSLMPHAEVAVIPGSHGGFNRVDELNDRMAAFIKAHASGKQAGGPPSANRYMEGS
jgi:pimeloyl-ACP methyl ester carboxylesterase